MSDRLTIWNVALGRISEGQTVDDPDEDTVPARACRRHYDLARDTVLSGHSWGFAKRIIRLALISDPDPTGWAYIYAYPSDAVAVRRVGLLRETFGGGAFPTWAIEPGTFHLLRPEVQDEPWEQLGFTSPGGDDSTAIGSNVPEAYVEYTRRITDETKFSALFADALAWRLAVDLAMVVARSDAMRQTAWNGYNVLMAQAAADSARQRQEQRPDSELIRARA